MGKDRTSEKKKQVLAPLVTLQNVLLLMLQNVKQTLWKVEQVKEGKDEFSSLLDFPHDCRDINIVSQTRGEGCRCFCDITKGQVSVLFLRIIDEKLAAAVLAILTSTVQKVISVHLTRVPTASGRFTAAAKKKKWHTKRKP